MDLNSDRMFLLAKIELLQKENDALKEERVTTLQKLELAQISVSLLKAEIVVMKEAKENERIEHHIQRAKIIQKLDKTRKDGKAIIAKLESDFNAGKELYRQKIVQLNELQEAIKDASAEMAAFKKQKEEEINEWQLRYADLKKDVHAKNSSSVRIIKDPFLSEELWCKFKWGQNDENIFLGDLFQFRLDPVDIEATQNFHKPLAYHLNWWLELNKTEKGCQFLKQPEIIQYRNNVCLAINRRFLERIHICVR